MASAGRLDRRRSRIGAREVSLSLRDAVALGLAHGPAELIPVSSSGHVTLIAWLVDSSYLELDLEFRKDFEVALHAGTAAALLVGGRGELAGTAWLHDRQAAGVIGLALVAPAVAGLALESGIERLGTPRRIAVGLVVGGLAMGLADVLGSSERRASDARGLDGLLLGLAQAGALVPGISRNGATLAVCRGRGFERSAADELSRDCGLPVTLGAVVVRGLRSAARSGKGRRRDGRSGRPLLAGGAAAFVSTLAARRLLNARERPVSLVACAAYRTAVAVAVLERLRHRQAEAGAEPG